MKKSTKMIAAASTAVVVLGAALAVVLLLPSEEGNDFTVTEENDILLFDKSQLTVEDITVKNASGEYQLLGYDYSVKGSSEESDTGEIKVIYTMQGYEDSMLSKYMTDTLVSECSAAAALRVVDKSGKKYVDYGLDKPSAEVTVIYSDDSKIQMSFGNEAPDKSGTYCRVDGDKSVYLVNSSSVDMFFMDKFQMFEKTLTKELDESENIANICISGTGYDKEIIVTNEKNQFNAGNYTMTSPYRENCDSSIAVSFGVEFFDFSASTVAAASVKSDELKNYGLDEPYMDIAITTTEGNSVEILTSEKDSDGNYYMMKAGGNIIYIVSEDDEQEWYGINYQYFLSDSILLPEMLNVNEIEITYNGESDEYLLVHETSINDLYEETTTTTLYYHDEPVNYINLFYFMTNVSAISRKKEVPESLDDCEEIFSIKLTFDDESETTDTFILYQTEDNRMIAVLNGHIESYVDTEFARKVIEQSPEIHGNDVLSIIETTEESA